MSEQYTNDPYATSVRVEPEARYDTQPAAARDTSKVLALGSVAAGLASGLIVLLTEREEKKPASKMEQARMAIEEATVKARQQGKTAGTSLSSTLQGLSAGAATTSKKARKDAKKRGSKLSKQRQKDAEQTMAKISDLLTEARKEAIGTYHTVEKQAPDMNKLARQAKGELGSLAETLKSKAAEAEKVTGAYIGSSVLPTLKSLEKEAANVLETGKEKGQEVRKHAEKDLLPQARKSADKLRHTLEDQAKVAAKSLEKGLPQAPVKLGAAAASVEEQAKSAGEAVKRGGRETASLLVWLGLAGTLVYKVFLNEEQQKKARELGAGVFGETKEMYADMKGPNSSLSA